MTPEIKEVICLPDWFNLLCVNLFLPTKTLLIREKELKHNKWIMEMDEWELTNELYDKFAKKNKKICIKKLAMAKYAS